MRESRSSPKHLEHGHGSLSRMNAHPAFPTHSKGHVFWGLAVLLLLLLFPFDTGHTEIAKALSDTCHGPLFALVAIGCLHHLKVAGKQTPTTPTLYLQTLLLTITLGILGEWAQYLFTTTRYAEAKDVLTDALGAVAGLSFHAQRELRMKLKPTLIRWIQLAIGLSCLAIIVPVAWTSSFYVSRWQQAPELVTFNSTSGYHFLHAGNAKITREPAPILWSTTPDEPVLKITPQNNGRWAGATLEEPLPDWSGYTDLIVELINPNERPLELILRIDDQRHNQAFNDRFNKSLLIAPRKRSTIIIPISEISRAPALRRLDITAISKLVLFEDTEHNTLPFYLCALRLSKR